MQTDQKLDVFYLTELRILQSTSKSNEDFLIKVSYLIGRLNEKLEKEKYRAEMAEHQVRLWENGEIE
ncbi:MAG TPA: hypothetical protein VFM18_11340 [Methanosarcina sp.]|nr:hypothetical protein [Methanosarcina sp.]